MLPAFLRTLTELLDSKKAAYSFVACFVLAILIVYLKVDRETALIIVSPLLGGAALQAHVDASAAKSPKPIEGQLLEVSETIRSASGTADPTGAPGTTPTT